MSVIVSLECCWVWDQETADEGQGAGEVSGAVSASSPLTVKDIMLNVIEMQLMKNQVPACQTAPTAPTISSILKTSSTVSATHSLATLSMVSSQHSLPMTPDLPKDSLVVVQVSLICFLPDCMHCR